MDPHTSLIYAIKQIPIKTKPDLGEIEILSRLSHENIVKFYCHECTPIQTFIVLEYIDGGSLAQLIKTFGPLQDMSLVKLKTRHILNGLVYLHDHNIIHKDLKAANVLVSSCGKTVLSDFGISSYFEPDSQLETPYLDNQVKLPLDSKVEEDIVGSAYWIAPEIVRMKGASFLSDIWSLGCVVCEMVEGQPPFYKKDPRHLFYLLATQDVVMDMPSGYEPFLKECFSYTNRMSAINLLQLDWFDPVVTDVTVDSNSKTTQCMIAPSKSGYDNHDNRISESLTLEIRESIESANVLVHCIRDTMDEFKELDIEDAVGGSDTTITTGDHGNKGKSDFKKIQHIKKCRIM